jgi:formylglycine-generating enzyme required for sulfatase activity
MSSEENENNLIISSTRGLIRRMDFQLELMNRLQEEIYERKTKIITPADSFIGMLPGQEREWEISPGVRMTFCWCPPGEFLMGSPNTEEGRENDESQVKVILNNGFWIAKTQVTMAQWWAVQAYYPTYFKGKNFPVVEVCWDDVQFFLTELNSIIGDDDGGKMVLPTEAQWEYACRAGETGPYSGGAIDEVAWYYDNSKEDDEYQTHEVGTKKANAWGLHDMHGNVEEWCDYFYDTKLHGGNDPLGAIIGTERVRRGGSFSDYAIHCRAAYRSFINSSSNPIDTGFRVARISIPR